MQVLSRRPRRRAVNPDLRRPGPATLADVDLDAVKVRMAETVEAREGDGSPEGAEEGDR